ncbi:MAG: RluA family pseudouridine synthase [Eubacteriales bacterium]|nr:RluA family pseudouridine synthase [Eubacteriales bacterium]
MLEILYEDSSLIVVWKPVGLESQSSRGFGADMVSELRRHIHKLSTKPGEPYVGVIHRLDKPVSGIMVYAKDKKAAAALSSQVSGGGMKKKYLAVLCGKPVDSVDKYVDYLLKDEKSNTSRIVDKGITGAKRAELICRTWMSRETDGYGTLTLAQIELLTGRHHQIRVQMAGHGFPLWGDNRYNPQFSQGQDGQGLPARSFPRPSIALSAYSLAFTHPATRERMHFQRLPDGEIFGLFSEALPG